MDSRDSRDSRVGYRNENLKVMVNLLIKTIKDIERVLVYIEIKIRVFIIDKETNNPRILCLCL